MHQSCLQIKGKKLCINVNDLVKNHANQIQFFHRNLIKNRDVRNHEQV